MRSKTWLIKNSIDDNKLSPNANNLTLVRIALASAVIYSHAFYPREHFDNFKEFLGTPISWLAVDGFFALSGFLVYRSLERSQSLLHYTLSRFSRIWPGIAAMAIVVTLLGLLYTTLPLRGYLLGTETKNFIIRNFLLLGYYNLSGIDCATSPCVINGSLWTIPWEIRCYIILGALFLVGLFSRKAMLSVVLPATALFAVFYDIPVVHTTLAHLLGSKMYFLDQIDRLWTAFAIGIAAYLLRARLPISWAIAVLLAGIALLARDTVFAAHVRTIAIIYLALCCGFKTGNLSARWPDYSFGLYIYGMPVMMALILSGLNASPPILALITFLSTLPVAALSWHLIEHPALKLGKLGTRRFVSPKTQP